MYLARDNKLDRNVALKFLTPLARSCNKATARFEQEARALATLSHPNIVRIFSIEESDHGYFISMEFVKGINLNERLQADKVELEEIIQILSESLRGLSCAHANEIVHRDIKPGNVLLSDDGAIKITDFGIAKVLGTDLTQTNETVGTISYMSPEQILGQPVSHKSDLWSVGVIAYELFSGSKLFDGQYEAEITYQIVHSEQYIVDRLTENFDPSIKEFLQRALQRDPDERFGSAEEMLDALHSLQIDSIDAKLKPRRRAVPIVAMIVGAAALISLSILGLFQIDPTRIVADESQDQVRVDVALVEEPPSREPLAKPVADLLSAHRGSDLFAIIESHVQNHEMIVGTPEDFVDPGRCYVVFFDQAADTVVTVASNDTIRIDLRNNTPIESLDLIRGDNTFIELWIDIKS